MTPAPDWRTQEAPERDNPHDEHDWTKLAHEHHNPLSPQFHKTCPLCCPPKEDR